MACDTWIEKLDAYLDRELPGAELKAFDEHLRSCSSCAAEGLARKIVRLQHFDVMRDI